LLQLIYAGGAQESGIAITNANFAATSQENENLIHEWVEISNLGTADVILAGWTLEGAQNHTYKFLPEDFIREVIPFAFIGFAKALHLNSPFKMQRTVSGLPLLNLIF
jgi:hypothetical protein